MHVALKSRSELAVLRLSCLMDNLSYGVPCYLPVLYDMTCTFCHHNLPNGSSMPPPPPDMIVTLIVTFVRTGVYQ